MRIQWAEPAVLDLESIRDYIARDSEFYALEFTERIIDVIEKLYDFPLMGRKVPEVDEDAIREILFYNYRIIYKVKDELIIILSIIHAVMNLDNRKLFPWEVVDNS